MSKVLVVAELAGENLRKTTHAAISCAREIGELKGGAFSILVMGDGATSAAAACPGSGTVKVETAISDPASMNSKTWPLGVSAGFVKSASAMNSSASAAPFGSWDCAPSIDNDENRIGLENGVTESSIVSPKDASPPSVATS